MQRNVTVRNRYRLTRLGLHFLFVAAFTMVGGALRGFNLLLVLSGVLIGALLTQWRCSRWVIESSAIERQLPEEVFARTRFRVRYRVRNLSRLLPIWMLRIEDRIALPGQQERAEGVCSVGMVRPQQTVTQQFECVVARRGVYQFGSLQVSTSFPFSLFVAKQISDDIDTLYVYPRLLKLRKGWQRALATQQGGSAAAARRTGAGEGDFFGLREWQAGDNLRWIHHRTTARVGEPIVRQFEQQRRFDACILVDCFGDPEEADQQQRVETTLRLAATIVANVDRAQAGQLVMSIADRPSAETASQATTCTAGARRMMRRLAEAVCDRNPDLCGAIDQAFRSAGRVKDLIVLSPRSFADALNQQSDRAALERRLDSWHRRGALRWIDISSSEFERWLSVDDSANGRREVADHELGVLAADG